MQDRLGFKSLVHEGNVMIGGMCRLSSKENPGPHDFFEVFPSSPDEDVVEGAGNRMGRRGIGRAMERGQRHRERRKGGATAANLWLTHVTLYILIK